MRESAQSSDARGCEQLADHAVRERSNDPEVPIADSALNGIVLLGEGGRVQIAVLCSTLGV